MPRPHDLRRSRLRDREGDTDVNRAGGWSDDQLVTMDRRFQAAMLRALTAQIPAACLPPRR